MVLEQSWQKRNKKYRMNRKINSIPVVRTKIGEQDRRTIMKKHIMGENGISYTLGEDGLYYPDLYLPEETEYPDWKLWNVEKDIFAGALERTISGAGTCWEVK